MSINKNTSGKLTSEEFNELNNLRLAISQNPACVHPSKMETFTELLVRSFRERGG